MMLQPNNTPERPEVIFLGHYARRTDNGLFVGIEGDDASAYYLDGQTIRILANRKLDGAAFPLVPPELYACKCDAAYDFRLPGLLRKLMPCDRIITMPEYAPELLAAWIYTVLLDKPTKPVPVLIGPPGSGKTSTARLLMRLLQGLGADVIALPRSAKDLLVVADNQRFLAIDNVDASPPGWFADTVAALATGAQAQSRRLWSDKGVITLQLKCGLILTSMAAPFNRADVADRSIVIEMARLDGFVPESQLFEFVDRVRMHFAGALLHDLNHLIQLERTIRSPREMFRMADFAGIVRLILGECADVALRALLEAQADLALRDDDVFLALRDALESRDELLGSAGEILEELKIWDRSNDTRTARAFGGYLRRIAAPAEVKGVRISWLLDRHRKSSVYRIELLGGSQS